MKFSFAPSSFIMSIGSIENPSCSLLPYPSPRFTVLAFHPFHEDNHVIVEMAMDVCLVPGFKLGYPFHDRMLGIEDIHRKVTHTMGFELATNRLDEPIGVPEAEGSTVNRD